MALASVVSFMARLFTDRSGVSITGLPIFVRLHCRLPCWLLRQLVEHVEDTDPRLQLILIITIPT